MQGCLICQKMQRGARSYGKLPARSVNVPPWHEVHVDCISPWTIELCCGCSYQFNALTSIDPTTNLLEIEELPRKTTQACADALNLVGWLNTLILSNVFMTKVMNSLGMNSNNFCPKQALSQFLPPHRICRVIVLLKRCTSLWALCFVFPFSSNARGSSTCGKRGTFDSYACDMLCFSWFFTQSASWCCCFSKGHVFGHPSYLGCSYFMDQCVLQANALQFSHDWNVNDQALKCEPLLLSDKMKPEWTGPYIVECVHANGTCTICLTLNVTEWRNIRQLKPFKPN